MTYAVCGVDNTMPCYHTGYDRHGIHRHSRVSWRMEKNRRKQEKNKLNQKRKEKCHMPPKGGRKTRQIIPQQINRVRLRTKERKGREKRSTTKTPSRQPQQQFQLREVRTAFTYYILHEYNSSRSDTNASLSAVSFLLPSTAVSRDTLAKTRGKKEKAKITHAEFVLILFFREITRYLVRTNDVDTQTVREIPPNENSWWPTNGGQK